MEWSNFWCANAQTGCVFLSLQFLFGLFVFREQMKPNWFLEKMFLNICVPLMPTTKIPTFGQDETEAMKKLCKDDQLLKKLLSHSLMFVCMFSLKAFNFACGKMPKNSSFVCE